MKHRFFQWLVALPLLVAAPLLGACGGRAPVPMMPSPATPAAQGTVTVHAAENGNTRLTVEVKHLARPEAVSPVGRAYFVWVLPPGGPPQNMGSLGLDDDLRGRLETLTPFQSFGVIVTAESLPATMSPRGPTVLEASVPQP